jgi:hypothetical protein
VNAATFPLCGGLNVVVIVIANAENGPTELPVHSGARACRQRLAFLDMIPGAIERVAVTS